MAAHAGDGQQVSLQTRAPAWVGGGKAHYKRKWFGHDVGNVKCASGQVFYLRSSLNKSHDIIETALICPDCRTQRQFRNGAILMRILHTMLRVADLENRSLSIPACSA